jgi:spore coat protein U-like protein
LDNGTGAGSSEQGREMTDSTSDELTYNVYQDAAHSILWGTSDGNDTVLGNTSSTTATIYGIIPGGQSSPAGSYTDTLTATISY